MILRWITTAIVALVGCADPSPQRIGDRATASVREDANVAAACDTRLAGVDVVSSSEKVLAKEDQTMTVVLTPENFDLIRRFVLDHGDRQTYGNMYNHNPHLRAHDVDIDIYLNPADGQENINCDPELGEFDTMVIFAPKSPPVSVSLDGNRLRFEPNHAAFIECVYSSLLDQIATTP